MSLNLYFRSKSGKENIDFPFQTPTLVSERIMKMGTHSHAKHVIEVRIDALHEMLMRWNWDGYPIVVALSFVKRMLEDDEYELDIK